MDNQTGPIIVSYILCVLIAWAIGSSKGAGGAGLFLGLLFGPLGIIFALITKPSVAVQAQRDVALEQAREAERERLREEGRAQARAEMQGSAATPYAVEIGQPPTAE